MKNYYEILEVNYSATEEVIKAAYKALIKKYHPDNGDRNDPSGEKLRLVTEAYECLADPIKKNNYDKQFAFEFKNTNSNAKNNSQYSKDEYKVQSTISKKCGIFSQIVSGAVEGFQEVIDQRQAEIENAYLEASTMSDYSVIREYRMAVGAKRAGYAKVLAEREYLERDNRGNWKPTEKYKRMR